MATREQQFRPVAAVHRIAPDIHHEVVDAIDPQNLGESGLWHLPKDLTSSERWSDEASDGSVTT